MRGPFLARLSLSLLSFLFLSFPFPLDRELLFRLFFSLVTV